MNHMSVPPIGGGGRARRRIAVIGSGISGLGAAWLLRNSDDVTLFEAEDRLGGHSNTVTVETAGREIPVDTGFIVLNDRTYPNLLALFRETGVPIEASDMSFAVSVDRGKLEYSGSPLGLVAQPANLLSPRYWIMLRDLVRFFRSARALLAAPADGTDAGPSLKVWLERERYSAAFIEDHLLPMAAAIWSCPVATMMSFPARSFIRFFDNHGLLDFTSRPMWRTVRGGSREYVNRLAADLPGRIRLSSPVLSVERMADGVLVRSRSGPDGAPVDEHFDAVVFGCHGDQARALLKDADTEERSVLDAFTYQDNEAILHSDPGLMPRRRAVWSAWNYATEAGERDDRRVAVTYWMNRLQNLDPAVPLFVSLNPLAEPRADLVHKRIDYAHPVFDAGAIEAQRRMPRIQGRGGVWYCGSYCGWGFHEDGLRSAISVVRALGVEPPWTTEAAPADGGALPARPPVLADAAD